MKDLFLSIFDMLTPKIAFIFFFFESSMIHERSPHHRREGGIDQEKGWRRRCLCIQVLKVIIISGRKDGGWERVPVIHVSTSSLIFDLK